MNHQLPFRSLSLILGLALLSTSACFNDNCDSRVSTEFRDNNDRWVPYAGVDQLILKNDENDTLDTLIIQNYESNSFNEQNVDNCKNEISHELQRVELSLASDPANTKISVFQSSEGNGLFSITHDEREILFLFREKVYEINSDNYTYFPEYTFQGTPYNDVLRIICEDAFEECPNYKQLFYQKGKGLIGFELDNLIWSLQ